MASLSSVWDTIISALPLLIFLGVVYAGIRISGLLNSSSAQTKSDLQKRGVTISGGRVSVKTDRPQPSRDEYIASTQRAFERGARQIGAHPEAFKVGQQGGAGGDVAGGEGMGGVSSATQTPERKGFQRGKKLA